MKKGDSACHAGGAPPANPLHMVHCVFPFPFPCSAVCSASIESRVCLVRFLVFASMCCAQEGFVYAREALEA